MLPPLHQPVPRTIEELTLEWAFAEIKSPRWELRFLQRMEAEQYERIRQAKTPRHLTLDDQHLLVTAFLQRRGWLVHKYLTPATRIERVRLTSAELGALLLLPEMTFPHANMLTYARGALDEETAPGETRNSIRAYMHAQDAHSINGRPIIAKSVGLPAPVLLEGYTRIAAYLRLCDARNRVSWRKTACLCVTNDNLSW